MTKMSSDLGIIFFIGAPKKNEKPVIRVFQNLAYFFFYEFLKKGTVYETKSELP